ncbi:MAG: hypothetical protein CMB99_11270 [Flavobacteriaceae bacterium]|nr:hypothetical protein [Flavobacteriaceae bacterium]|tara:strand:+ start:66187 stop:66642 length:456 start_codon:yes stop_codon:yes gene_type:complete
MKNILTLTFLTISFLFTTNTNAQVSNYVNTDNEIQVFDKLEMNGEFRKSLRLLDFLRKDARFGINRKLTNTQINYNSSMNGPNEISNSNSNYWLYFNDELILGDGLNRLWEIDQVRLKKVKTVAVRKEGSQRIVFVTTMDADSQIKFVKSR